MTSMLSRELIRSFMPDFLCVTNKSAGRLIWPPVLHREALACPSVKNEQRTETHADIYTHNPTPHISNATQRLLCADMQAWCGINTHGHLPLPCPVTERETARFRYVKNKASDKRQPLKRLSAPPSGTRLFRSSHSAWAPASAATT